MRSLVPKVLRRLISFVRRNLYTIRFYLRITRASEVARRYAVSNTFDITLTLLGAVLFSYVAGAGERPEILLGLGIGAAVGSGLSGMVSTLITEWAERSRRVAELEHVLLTKLRKTAIERAEKFAAVYSAVLSGFCPFAAALLITIPFILTIYGIVPSTYAIVISISIALAMLYVVGALLGKYTGRRPLTYGLYTLLAGLLVLALTRFIS